jgi:hypothetical protein
MTLAFIFALCVFFTILALVKPEVMWGILAAVSWMMMFWWTRDNLLTGIVLGDLGDTGIISICIGASTAILLYTIVRDNKRRKIERGELDEKGRPIETKETGTRENSDDYYERLNRITHPKK